MTAPAVATDTFELNRQAVLGVLGPNNPTAGATPCALSLPYIARRVKLKRRAVRAILRRAADAECAPYTVVGSGIAPPRHLWRWKTENARAEE